jgi:ABC-type dipeptide/oligopeptide/nickel transport system permease subunit
MRYRIVLLIWVMMIVFAPLLTPHSPMQTNPNNTLQPPTLAHLLGTDYLGRDVWSRVLYGGQRTLWIAGISSISVIVVATCVGMLGLVNNRLTQASVQLVLDILLVFPVVLLALILLTLLGRGTLSIIIALSIAQLAPFASMVITSGRLALKTDFVMASQALGASHFWILARHVLLAIRPTFLVYCGTTFAYIVLNGAGLGFLGLGDDPSLPEWGMMLADGRFSFRIAPWVTIAPGIAIGITVFCVNRIIEQVDSP